MHMANKTQKYAGLSKRNIQKYLLKSNQGDADAQHSSRVAKALHDNNSVAYGA